MPARHFFGGDSTLAAYFSAFSELFYRLKMLNNSFCFGFSEGEPMP
jgi:hypothetical protein